MSMTATTIMPGWVGDRRGGLQGLGARVSDSVFVIVPGVALSGASTRKRWPWNLIWTWGGVRVRVEVPAKA